MSFQKELNDLREILFRTDYGNLEKTLKKPGTGKTHLSIGLRLKACKEGYSVRFYTAAGLVTELTEAQDSRRLSKLEKQLENVDLLILDEFILP